MGVNGCHLFLPAIFSCSLKNTAKTLSMARQHAGSKPRCCLWTPFVYNLSRPVRFLPFRMGTPISVKPLRVLITNILLHSRSGTEMYVRDLAMGLLSRGHFPVLFSPRLGPLADELRDASVPVVDQLERIAEPPDAIHGHHGMETMMALLHFAQAPGIFVCHDAAAWHDAAPRFPRLYQYVAVDLACRERLISQHGVAPDLVHLIQNAVDLNRFLPRAPLPAKPERALLISNYVNPSQADSIRMACKRAGIQLDVAGQRLGGTHQQPEQSLRESDIVFAKGRCAWEALATGAAVIVCDAAGVGPMVTRAEVERLRQWNFGRRLLRQPITEEIIAAEIGRYNADDAALVTRYIRSIAGTEMQLDQLLDLYRTVIQQQSELGVQDRDDELKAAAQFLRSCAITQEALLRANQQASPRFPKRRKRHWWSRR